MLYKACRYLGRIRGSLDATRRRASDHIVRLFRIPSAQPPPFPVLVQPSNISPASGARILSGINTKHPVVLNSLEHPSVPFSFDLTGPTTISVAVDLTIAARKNME